MLLDRLNDVLRQAVQTLDSGSVPALRWEVPKDHNFGDLSSPVAFKLAAQQRRSPPEVAQRLITLVRQHSEAPALRGCVERVEHKGGFVNVWLSHRALLRVLAQVRREGARYGHGRFGGGRSVLIEFVSANPTGPLSVAHGRQAAVGDALAQILRSQGCRVTTEYYLNDEGRQIELLGRSLLLRCKEQLGQPEPLPEGGYQGLYLIEQAKACVKHQGARLLEQPPEWFMEEAMTEQSARIKHDLARFGLRFDRWVSQRALRHSERIDQALGELARRDLLYEQDGATWFASTRFGDDKDRVVKKQTGELTYLAPDIAYHRWKFQRGYHQVINLWGPDHHGYISRVKAAVAALGFPAERLIVRIVQLVTLSRQGKPVPMSKREGEFVTFREVLDEVGVDATRFFYLMRTMESHLDFDLDLAASQSQDNPVYYVQYAHARIWSILSYARRQVPWWRRLGPPQRSRLTEPEERLLLRQLVQFPMITEACARALEPQGLTVYLQRLAELFHVFYTKHRVVTEDIARSRARLALVDATRIVLANGLHLLGVSAPRRM
ncbi:MAG: arginine--tRNA ligase [Candidatus Omnitrophica bacterium]|nr:arginine--tRNA ligase [Candidatus Omnitrophota bacterium]